MKKFDVFISYRREGGLEMADSIYQRLYNAGYSVFMDLEQLNSGKFNEKLFTVIDQCTDFILVLPPNALDRCNEDYDWVRLEVEYAMSRGKNIIPVMLRGFEWPDSDSLPESLHNLPNYNGISASDHNVFVENIERLKHSFMKSKRGFTWRRFKKYIIPVIIIILGIIGVYCYFQSIDNDKFDQMSKDYSQKMIAEMVKQHENLAYLEFVIGEWDNYVKESKNSANRVAALNDLTISLNRVKKELYVPNVIVFSDEFKKEMTKRGQTTAEIELVNVCDTLYYSEIQHSIEKILRFANFKDITDMVNNAVHLEFEMDLLSLKQNYLQLLHTYTFMSDEIYPEIEEVVPELTYLSNIQIRLNAKDYELMIKSVFSEMEKVANKLEWNTMNLERELELMEIDYSNVEDSLERELERVEKISKTSEENNILHEELTEYKVKSAEKYNQALKKFALESSDSQGIMWGKILRMAKLAEMQRQLEISDMKDYNQLLVEAKNKGVNPNSVAKPVWLVPATLKFNVVDNMLTQYEKFNPAKESEISDYVNSAKLYFRGVLQGKFSADVGLLVMGTNENKTHPAFKIGDIITKCNGKIIHNTEDYINSKKGQSESKIVVLRNIKSQLKEVTISFSTDCPVLIGAFELHE